MKNSEILALVQGGVLEATQHTVSMAHAYKVFKLKSQVRKAFNALLAQDDELVKECGIEDAQAFDMRRAELASLEKPSESERKELEEMNGRYRSLVRQRKELHDEEVTLDGVKAIPYEEWRKLQDENRQDSPSGQAKDVFSGIVEELLFGVLWNAPEDGE